MAITGKYDLKGMQKYGTRAIKAALSSSPVGSFLSKVGLLGWAGDLLTNWMANNGLVVMNIVANYVNGELDQKALDKSIDDGLARVEQGNVSPEEGEKIDEQVRKAARRFIPFGK